MAEEAMKYSNHIKEIPWRTDFPSFEFGALMEQPFFEFEGLSVRYGLCGKEGQLTEETDKQHAHDYDQLLFFFSSDTSDMLDLGAEIEMTIGERNERFLFRTPTAVSIPKGTPHFSAFVRNVSRKFIFFAVSCTSKCSATVLDPNLAPDAGPLARWNSDYKGNVQSLRFMKKGGYFYGSEVLEDSGGIFTSSVGAQSGLDLTMTWQSIHLPHNMGPRMQDLSHVAHVHNFNEALFFFGMDPDDPTQLGGVCEFCLGKEQEPHPISKPSAVLAPKGFFHTPQRFLEVDKPYIFVALSCSAEHHKTRRK